MKQIRVRHYGIHEQFALNQITVVVFKHDTGSWRLSRTADIVKDMQAGTEESERKKGGMYKDGSKGELCTIG